MASASGRLISLVDVNQPSWIGGEKAIAAAGTAEQLPDVSVPHGCKVCVRGHPDNTGNIYIGVSKVHAEAHTIPLAADDCYLLRATNVNLVWADAAVNGEKLVYTVTPRFIPGGRKATATISNLEKWGGAALTGRDISLDLANLDIALSILAKHIRWQRNIDISWVHADEQTAPGAGTALVTKTVGAGKTGYIYGFLISTQEANDFKVNWTSGGVAKARRVVFTSGGTVECVDVVALNEGLGADAATNITITNINAAGAGKIYQASLLYGEV